MIVYVQGSVRHTGSIPVGGEHFTNDIAVGLRTTIPEAEKVKRYWAELERTGAPGGVLEVPSVGERPARVVSYDKLNEIIQPRTQESDGVDPGRIGALSVRCVNWERG